METKKKNLVGVTGQVFFFFFLVVVFHATKGVGPEILGLSLTTLNLETKIDEYS